MIDFIYNHPDYLFFLFLILFIIYRVILEILRSQNGEDPDNDDDGGGFFPEDPILDLPPGVSLPKEREPEPVH